MAPKDIPILVVDDAKYSSAIMAKVLRSGGFTNVRFTNNPLQALRSLERRPVHILIADWLMSSMDGVELTEQVRKLDDVNEHHTHVMLLTNRDDITTLEGAFARGVDDFLNKGQLRAQLLARVTAAGRIVARQNDLLHSNRLLRRKIRELQTNDVIDPVTGLGNLKFTLDSLSDLARQVETRGGAAALLLVGIKNLESIESQFEAHTVDELLASLAARVSQMVRPLDVVTRPERNMFAIIVHTPTIDACVPSSFQRLFDSLYMRSFKTTEGLHPGGGRCQPFCGG